MLEHHLYGTGPDAECRVADAGRHRLDRVTPGDDDDRHRHQRQRHAADQRRRSWQVQQVEEDRQAQQTEDDRRHRSEVVDRHFDDVCPPCLGRIFLQIERGRHAHRETEQQRHQHRQQRALERAPDADLRWIGAVTGRQEIPVETGRQHARLFQPRDGGLGFGRPFALGRQVDAGRSGQGDRLGPAEDRGIGLDRVADGDPRGRRQERVGVWPQGLLGDRAGHHRQVRLIERFVRDRGRIEQQR